MRSYERDGDNSCGGVKEPAYNILSYTWGRWQMPVGTGESISIQGIDWQTPAVYPHIFSVAEFQSVLQRVSTGVDWVWVDVACIDQKNVTVRDDEIGRQAGIFNKAKEAFVWLHHSPLSKLQRIANMLFETADNAFEIQAHLAQIYGISMGDIDPGPDQNDKDGCVIDDAWVDNLLITLEILDDDPWFSSLWTLQESHLRSDATLLSKDGLEVQREGYSNVGVESLLTSWGYIDQAIRRALRDDPSDAKLSAWFRGSNGILARMDRLGLSTGDNPVILYSAAGFRQTGPFNEDDRIYGIMQVFGLKLGKSVSPGVKFSLSELEVQFSDAINSKSPVWAQLFVHMKIQPAGRHWCISQSSRLPESLTFVGIVPRSCCQILLNGLKRALFVESCSFEDLRKAWDGARAPVSPRKNFWATNAPEMPSVEFIALDHCEFACDYVPVRLRQIENETSEKNQELGELLENYRCNIKVFLLGKIVDPVGDEESDGEGEDALEALVGMLVRPIRRNSDTFWQRIGIAIWADIATYENTHSWQDTRSMLD